MKKLVILIMVGVILAAGYVNVMGIELINKQESKQFEQYQKQEQRVQELDKLHNPIIIQNELKRVGKLTTLEGQMQYATKITDNKKLLNLVDVTLREMTLDIWYQFGLGIDTQYIKVKQINNDGMVVIQIPKSRIQLQFLQLNANKSSIKDGKKMIFVSEFKPSEVQTVIEQSQQAVANKIGSSPKLFDTALNNLENQLEGLVKSLGYKQIKFEEV